MANITPADVRYRLRSISTTAEISDGLLNSPAYIPGCESFINQILANNSTSYGALSADKKNLVKMAEIAMVCQRVVTDAPVESFDTGIIKDKPITTSDKVALANALGKEWKDTLELIGCAIKDIAATWMVNEGNDYMPDGDDDTNVLWTDSDYTVISNWP